MPRKPTPSADFLEYEALLRFAKVRKLPDVVEEVRKIPLGYLDEYYGRRLRLQSATTEDLLPRWKIGAALATLYKVDRYLFSYLDVVNREVNSKDDALRWLPILQAIVTNVRLPLVARRVWEILCQRWSDDYAIDCHAPVSELRDDL